MKDQIRIVTKTQNKNKMQQLNKKEKTILLKIYIIEVELRLSKPKIEKITR